MSELQQLYDRFDGWTRELSRTGYAVFVGTVSFSCYAVVSASFGDPNFSGAFGIGFTLAVLLSAFDANDQT